MDNSQIAHDLAIIKLQNSNFECKELVEQYRKYYQEILVELNSKSERRKDKITRSPF